MVRGTHIAVMTVVMALAACGFSQVVADSNDIPTMGIRHTNNSEQRDWKDRKTVRHMRQSGGTAYEYMIQLANETGKEPWICIPHLVTDDYVRQLARLLKTALDPKLRVWIEYSNEIWNPAFKQTQWLWQKAREEGRTKQTAELPERRPRQVGLLTVQGVGACESVCAVPARIRPRFGLRRAQ